MTLELDQDLRGLSRLGGFMVKRASGDQLDGALNGLASVLGESENPARG